MFQSEPICILQAGPTVDGRVIEQSTIDQIAESYDPIVYNARINEEHWEYSYKYGSVLSVEKRDNQLWAVLKPNSMMLRALENDQLVHTSCEIHPNFAATGKAYLTGLALTDDPASLGNTKLHLSANQKNDDVEYLSSGATIKWSDFDDSEVTAPPSNKSEATLLSKIKALVTFSSNAAKQEPSVSEEDEEVNEEIKTLLSQQTQALLGLTEAVTKLSAQPGADEEVPSKEEPTQLEELTTQVTELSAQLADLTEKFSNSTDEQDRQPAGGASETTYY